MALFRYSKQQAQQVAALSMPPDNEKGLQSLVEANLEAIFGVRFISSEFKTGAKHGGRIDTLGLDQDGSPVILEYKRSTNDNIINQSLYYLDWLMDHRGDFEVAAKAALGNDTEISWSAPRLILLAGNFNKYDRYAVNRIVGQIELWTFTFYGNDLLRIEPLERDEKAATASKTRPKQAAKKVGPQYDLTHHLATMSPETTKLFEEIRDRIMSLGDDITERPVKQYIGYKRLKNFVEIVGQQKKLLVFLDGLPDGRGLAEDVAGVGRWATGTWRVAVSDSADIEKAFPLIKEAYELQE